MRKKETMLEEGGYGGKGEGCSGPGCERRRGEMRAGGTSNGRAGLELTDCVVPVPPPSGTWFGSELW